MKNTQKGFLTTIIIAIILIAIGIGIGIYIASPKGGSSATSTSTSTGTTNTGTTTGPVILTPPTTGSPITINVSPSTNTKARTYVIQQDGSGVSAAQVYKPGTFSKLVSLVDTVANVSLIPEGSCAKSASFGTVTLLSYNGHTSPDLQCVGTGATKTEVDLATEVGRVTSSD